MQSPFRIGGSVGGEFFTDRAATLQKVEATLLEPQAKLLLLGRRRMGKTSALEAAVRRVKRKKGLALMVDFSAATTPTDLTNRLLREAVALVGRERSSLLDVLAKVKLGAGLRLDEHTGSPTLMIELSRRDAPVDEQRATLGGVLDALEALAMRRQRSIGIVIDEFQEVTAFGGEDAEWHLRGVIQRHKRLSYVCAGSQEALIKGMLGPGRAFYKLFEQHYLGPIEPEHFAHWIEGRMKVAGVKCTESATRRIVELGGARTRDVVQLARAAYEIAAPSGTLADAEVRKAFARVLDEEDHLLRAVWSQLPALQQNLLRAVAAGENRLTSQEARTRFSLAASGSVVPALHSLQEKEVLTREDDGVYRFDSPFLRGWVTLHALPDVGIVRDPAIS